MELFDLSITNMDPDILMDRWVKEEEKERWYRSG